MYKSLLFLMGVGLDTPTIIAILIFFASLGALVFLVTRRVIRKLMKVQSVRAVTMLSLIISFFITPILLASALTLVLSISVETAHGESSKETVRAHYRVMERDLEANLKEGMSRKAVVELLGDADTTSNEMVYDLSLPDTEEKFIVHLQFEKGYLTSFKRSKVK